MTLDKIEATESRILQIIGQLSHVDFQAKEPWFGKADLFRELNQLKIYLERLKARELNLIVEDYDMQIEFETQFTTLLTFSMVEAGELFVDCDGHLYQKSHSGEDDEKDVAWRICDNQGNPDGIEVTFYADEKIDRILPKIKRISF